MSGFSSFHTPARGQSSASACAPSHQERPMPMSGIYEVHTPARGRSSASTVRRRTKKGRR